MELLLIGGVSGSGKSVALAALEDSGYYAVNNLPLPLLPETARYLQRAGQRTVAIGLDAKTEPGLATLPAMIDELRGAGFSVRFLYLDARTDTLVKRYSETRRRHPFTSDTRTLTEAIDFERELIADVRPLAIVFDTSQTSAAMLRSWIKGFASIDAARLTVQIESFGFKHGVPLDTDLAFDVRCLPNPHYEPELAPLTGRDAPVIAFLEAHPEVERMYADIRGFVTRWLPEYARDNRNYLTIAIGCTGGRHRSVYLVERLARSLSPEQQVQVRHRELG
jgi:UPF0042 nucleotide-binding protein